MIETLRLDRYCALVQTGRQILKSQIEWSELNYFHEVEYETELYMGYFHVQYKIEAKSPDLCVFCSP